MPSLFHATANKDLDRPSHTSPPATARARSFSRSRSLARALAHAREAIRDTLARIDGVARRLRAYSGGGQAASGALSVSAPDRGVRRPAVGGSDDLGGGGGSAEPGGAILSVAARSAIESLDGLYVEMERVTAGLQVAGSQPRSLAEIQFVWTSSLAGAGSGRARASARRERRSDAAEEQRGGTTTGGTSAERERRKRRSGAAAEERGRKEEKDATDEREATDESEA